MPDSPVVRTTHSVCRYCPGLCMVRREDGAYERIGVEPALDAITVRLRAILDGHRPRSVATKTFNPALLPMSRGGSLLAGCDATKTVRPVVESR